MKPQPFPRSLAAYCCVMFGAAMGCIALSLALHDVPPVGPIILFGALAVFAQQRVVMAAGVDFAPNFFIFVAAIVVFQAYDAPAGAAIVGLVGGVLFPALTRRTWGWIVFNGSMYAISVTAASFVYALTASLATKSLPLALLAAPPAALTLAAVMWLLLVLSYVAERTRPPASVLQELPPQLWQSLPFAALGFLVGRLYLELGAAVLLLIVVPIVVAREMFASYLRVKEAHDETVQLLIRALEQKDPYTAGHAGRVAVYAGYIAEELDFMPSRAERLRFAALMHDIGKLVVPNQLLNKPGKLTEEEFKRIRIHERVSVQMLSHIDFLRPIAGHGHSDAMRFDPDDTDHPIEPYIIMVADAYDAMTSTRSYRKALPQEVAFQELRDKAGTQFHPEAAEALIRGVERRHEVHGAGHEEELHFEDAPEMGLGSAGLGDLVSEEKAKEEKAKQ
jgi:5'-deoxynucleotidase YfbR-like HD superfamily hydrolase